MFSCIILIDGWSKAPHTLCTVSPTTGTKKTLLLGSVGVMRASDKTQAEVASYRGVELGECGRLGELTSFYVAITIKWWCVTSRRGASRSVTLLRESPFLCR